jgi:UDP-glucose 4-epimerase
VEGDIRNTPLLEATIQKHKIEAVIHCAGLKAVGESVTNPLKYYDNNLSNSVTLLKAALSANIKYFIFSSSAAVTAGDTFQITSLTLSLD